MSTSQQPANLADMVRDRAKSRGDALAYEFEGRQTSFAEFDIRTNRVANALISLGVKPGDEAGARTMAMNPMGRVGTMEELQNLAVFLISGGCDWINGETIAMDGAQGLAMGGNFYQLRDWSDDDWTKARDSIKAQNEKDRAARG